MIIYFLDLFWKFCFFIFFNEKMTIVRIRSKDKFEFDWIRDDFLDLLDKKKKDHAWTKGKVARATVLHSRNRARIGKLCRKVRSRRSSI